MLSSMELVWVQSLLPGMPRGAVTTPRDKNMNLQTGLRATVRRNHQGLIFGYYILAGLEASPRVWNAGVSSYSHLGAHNVLLQCRSPLKISLSVREMFRVIHACFISTGNKVLTWDFLVSHWVTCSSVRTLPPVH
jgi:hypothetical protein